MTIYGIQRNYNAYNFNTSTLVINKEKKAEGIKGFECGFTNPRTTIDETADGQAQFVENPSTVGKITIRLSETSPTTSVLWGLWKAGGSFSVSFTDSNVPDLKCSSSKTRFGELPPFKRSAAPEEIIFVLECTYLDVMGGGFSLESE